MRDEELQQPAASGDRIADGSAVSVTGTGRRAEVHLSTAVAVDAVSGGDRSPSNGDLDRK
jgi:hypothetical protein